MEICVNGSPLSETQLPYYSDSNEHIVIENICTENSFVQAISIHSFRCETTVCEIVTFAHSFHKDFLSTVSKSSIESVKSLGMYGAYNPTGNNHFHTGNVKYYSPTELSKICRQNQDSPSTRDDENIEQEKPRRHHQEMNAEEKKKKANKDKRKNKRECKEETSYGPYYMMTNQEYDEKKEKKHKRDRKKEFSELNYYDLQCLLNDCNRDTNIPANVKKDRNYDTKKQHRSQSIDQIPTKEITSEQKIWGRPERPRSAERREDSQVVKNKEFFMGYHAQNPVYDQNGQNFIQHSSKRHKLKQKSRKKNMDEDGIPEFVTLDEINEQTMNLKDEKFEHHKYNKWETEKKFRHHQQREFYGEYHQQQNRNNLDIDHDFNTHVPSPHEYEEMLQNYYQSMANKVDTSRAVKKERKKEKNKDQKKKENDKEYRAMKKYMKKLAKEQQKDTFYFTTNGEATAPVHDKRDSSGMKYSGERHFEPDYNMGNVDTTRGHKRAKKEFVPLDLGLEELEIPPKNRKNHDHKRHKNKKGIVKTESSERMRSASLSMKEKHKKVNDILQKNDEYAKEDTENVLKTKYKSETSLDSNQKDIVCIYQSKDSPDEKDDINTVKLSKKPEYLSFVKEKKYNKKADIDKKEKERSPYDRNQMVLPTENKKQISDVLNMQERTLLFQKAMKRDFPVRPRPRLSRSRQRSSRYLPKLEDTLYHHSNMQIDEKPTKEVHCYDVGTSTILDNNFGEVLELLKGEPSLKPTCTNKRRSVFHVKKKASREDLVETSRKACDNGEQTMGIVVKGIEPPKKIETSKVRSKFKFSPEKTKTNRLECKILSVVAITPTKFEDEQEDTDQNPIKTQSTPQMLHDADKRNPSSDKRLERLLKYYKVEAQSKMSEQSKPSQKSMKELITSRLSDYLRKLQDDDNDDMLQIQTDDPKVVKLVLPIEYTGVQCSTNVPKKKNDQDDKKPRESFSDLNINYSGENNEEDDDLQSHLRVPKGMEANRTNLENLIFNRKFDSKLKDQQSENFLKTSSLNFSNIESKSEFPFSPRLTEEIIRNPQELEIMKEFTFSQEVAACHKTSSRLPVQRSSAYTFNPYQGTRNEYDYYFDSEGSPSFNKAEGDCTQTSDRTDTENVKYNSRKQQRQHINDMNPIKELNSSPLRRSNERAAQGISKPPNIESIKNFKIEREVIESDDMAEDIPESEEPAVTYPNKSASRYQSVTSKKEFKIESSTADNDDELINFENNYLDSLKSHQQAPTTRSKFPSGKEINKTFTRKFKMDSSTADNNDEIITLENNSPTPLKSHQIPLTTRMYDQKSKFSNEKEINKTFMTKEIEGHTIRTQENDNKQLKRINNDRIKDTPPAYQGLNSQTNCENKASPRKQESFENCNTIERKKINQKIISQPQQQPIANSKPTRGYEYFEIPPPRSKPMKKTRSEERNISNIPPKYKNNTETSLSMEARFSKVSQIPKRITNTTKNMETPENFSYGPQQKQKDEQSELKKYYENIEPTWKYQKEHNELDNSLVKCLHWDTRNSETVVMSELNDFNLNKTSEAGKSTLVPKKSHIPVAKKDQNKSRSNQGRSSSAGTDKNTTMLLTKTYKMPLGQSSYERRKMYDTRIRKNVKRRSLSESNGPAKMLPLIYEVRYCNVFNQCSPYAFDSGVLGGSRSDQDLSILSTDFDANDFKKSIESLTTVPSCFLKENKYNAEEQMPSTEPSCLFEEKNYSQNIEDVEVDLFTEPSCLLKESKYNVTLRNDDQDNEETCSNFSSKSERIQELIKENLLYAKFPSPNKKTKPPHETKKRRKKVEKEKSTGTKMLEKHTSKPKITLRCSKKHPKENGKRLKIVAKLKKDCKENSQMSTNQDDNSPQCQNLTKLSIDKVNENEFRVSFEEQKLESEVKEATFDEKSVVPIDNEYPNDIDSLDYSVSSKSTVINCAACSSVTSQESKETVKEREVFATDDSGYLTKGAEINHSETTIESTNDGKACCSNIFKGFSSKASVKKSAPSKHKNIDEESSKWNQKDLVKLRIQLLFPHVYDDFELLETARNTDLIKYYVESGNSKLKEAIESISQKDEMSTRSRSVISLPSVKMIPEEPNESAINGDMTSEYSAISQEGGFYNYQKFVAQNNVCYSANVLSKLTKPDVGGDSSDTLKDNLSEIKSVNSCNVPVIKSGVTMKKSVIELFKLRPSSAKRSSSSMFSDNETLVEGNEEESVSMRLNISDEEFFDNFHEIMALECQRYARKVRDQSKANENPEDDLEYEEIPLDCLLKNKNLNTDSSEDYMEQEFQLASDEIVNDSTESTKKESNESFKSVTCLKENVIKPKKSNSKWQKLVKKKSSSMSKLNLDFYPEERMSILNMIESVHASALSEDSLNCSPRDKVLSVISSGEVTKHSEKQFFDNLLAFYDKESEFIKKLIRDDEFFSSLIETIRNSDDSTQLIFMKDIQGKVKKEKKKGIFSRFFRWKEKKSTETLFENPSIGKSLEFAKSLSNESTSITRESCYSFYKDLDDLENLNEVKHPNSEHLQQLAYKAKCHLEPMVKATISNRHISDKIKLAGFLKMLDMVAKGDFTFLNNGDNKTLEEKLRDHVAQMFEKVYLIANREVAQKNMILDSEKIQLLKMLVTKYHMGVETHINILSIYIGRGLIESRAQLEDAIIFLMGQDSQDINLEQFEKICGIPSG